MRRAIKIILLCVYAGGNPAQAGSFTVAVGPEQLGTGGAYPMAMPPTDPFQWGFTWVTDAGTESTISLCPGILIGHRFNAEGFFLSTGGGIILDANGTSVGPYSTFGYESGGRTKGWHFTANYTQGLGLTSSRYMAPSAMRFGTIWEY